MATYSAKYNPSGNPIDGATQLVDVVLGTGEPDYGAGGWVGGVDDSVGYVIVSDTNSTGLAGHLTGRGNPADPDQPTFWRSADLTDASLIELINRLPSSPGGFTDVTTARNWLNGTGVFGITNDVTTTTTTTTPGGTTTTTTIVPTSTTTTTAAPTSTTTTTAGPTTTTTTQAATTTSTTIAPTSTTTTQAPTTTTTTQATTTSTTQAPTTTTTTQAATTTTTTAAPGTFTIINNTSANTVNGVVLHLGDQPIALTTGAYPIAAGQQGIAATHPTFNLAGPPPNTMSVSVSGAGQFTYSLAVNGTVVLNPLAAIGGNFLVQWIGSSDIVDSDSVVLTITGVASTTTTTTQAATTTSTTQAPTTTTTTQAPTTTTTTQAATTTTTTQAATTTTTTSAGGDEGWFFYQANEGALTVGPPTSPGNSIFLVDGNVTFNPNYSSGGLVLYFNVKNAFNTSFLTQFQTLQTNGGRVTISQGSNSVTYSMGANVCQIYPGNQYVRINATAATLVTPAASPFTYGTLITITF
jgi:hypothetical protein